MRTWLCLIPMPNSQLTEERLHYRYPVSPYLGETLRGVVKATYLRVEPVFEDGKFPGEPVGREWRGDRAYQSLQISFTMLAERVCL